VGAPPATRAADRTLARPRRRPLAAAAALAALLAVGAGTLLDLRTPDPRPADAPAGEFSADRAYQNVTAIAARPHPAGSPANDQVRGHLEGVLRGLGLETEVQDTVAPEAGQLQRGNGNLSMSRVRNVIARLPGTDPTGKVVLVAHYDSVQSGPGGNDDAAGTSTILEVARALTTGPRPRNDIVFLLTDAEEACLCGASAFVSSHPLARDGGVALNLEARGSTGPVIMFETSRNNAKLIDVFGRAAPHPVGTSFAVEVYRLLPNDTDFTPFRDSYEGLSDEPRFVGLNSAYIDGGAIYHTPLDIPTAMDRASLQQHGDNALGMAREFGRLDLKSMRSGHDATYFPVPGGLVRYPGWLTWPLALAAVVGVLVLGGLALRQGRTSGGRLAAGFGLALVPIVAAPLAAQLFWSAVTTIQPGHAELLDPYRPTWYRLAVVALAVAVVLGWYVLLRRWAGPIALAVGGLGWLALLGLPLALLAPGGSYLVTLPALAGVLAGLVALATRMDGLWPTVAVTAAGAVAVVILLPTVVLLFPALGMAMGGVAAFFTVLLGLAALPVVDLLHPQAGGQRGMIAGRARRLGALPVGAAAVAAMVFAGVGLAVDRFDAAHPAPTHLMYAMDADTRQARWLSHEDDPQPWTARYVGKFERVGGEFPGLDEAEYRSGPAQPADLPAPELELLSDVPGERGNERVLRLRVTPQRPVRVLTVHVDSDTAEVLDAQVAGIRSELPWPLANSPWTAGLTFHAPPPEGIEVTLRLIRKTDRVRVRVMDVSDGLDRLPGFQPRPPGVGIAGSHSSEMLAVARTYPV
jgi:hypothetical protein